MRRPPGVARRWVVPRDRHAHCRSPRCEGSTKAGSVTPWGRVIFDPWWRRLACSYHSQYSGHWARWIALTVIYVAASVFQYLQKQETFCILRCLLNMAAWNWEGLYARWSRQNCTKFCVWKIFNCRIGSKFITSCKRRPRKLTPGYVSHLGLELLFPAAAALWYFK